MSLEREPGQRISISRSLPAQTRGFPGGTSGKEPACQCRLDIRNNSSISGPGKSLGEGNGNPLQYSCLENPMDRAAWRATVHGVAQSWTQLKRLSTAQQLPGLGGNCMWQRALGMVGPSWYLTLQSSLQH